MKILKFKNTAFKDKRGLYWTSWEKKKYPKLNFNHDKISISKKNVIRGLHGDNKSWKLISCVYGKIFFVVINYDNKSKNYLKKKTFILSHQNRLQILVPPKFLNGMLCLSKTCVLHYKWCYKGQYYDVKKQFSLKWNDKSLNIKWPIKGKPILSNRDK